MLKRIRPARVGFTLVELLVVIAIIAILLSLGFFLFRVGQDAADQITEDVEVALIKLERKALPPPRAKDATLIPNQFMFVFGPRVVDAQTEVQRLKTFATLNVIHVYDGPGLKGFSAKLGVLDMQNVLKDSAIEGAEQDYRVNVLGQIVPRGVQRINVDLAYSGGSAGKPWSDVGVAIIDTGIDARHPDLKVAGSHGFVDGDAGDTADRNGHGTHVAGIIGAINNKTGVVGVAPGVQLYNLKVLDADGSGSYADVVAALNWVHAHSNKIHVANLSLGGPASRTINAAVNACVDAGVVMVVAAGNEAKPASKFSPSSASKAIAVGALADTDGQAGSRGNKSSYGVDDSFASFSNYGPSVKVLAPGVGILSTLPVKQGGYGVMSGTSMASPHVAGLAARIHHAALDPTAPAAATYFPGRASKRATPAEVLQVMEAAAKEKIAGRNDSRQYPLISAKGL